MLEVVRGGWGGVIIWLWQARVVKVGGAHAILSMMALGKNTM